MDTGLAALFLPFDRKSRDGKKTCWFSAKSPYRQIYRRQLTVTVDSWQLKMIN